MKRQYLLLIFTVVVCLVAVSGAVTAEKNSNTSMKRVIFNVDNLTCGGCFTTINESLKPLEGFNGFGANLLRKLIAVDFIEPLTPDTIAKAIIDSGYPVDIESISEITEKESFAYIQKKRDAYFGNAGQGQGGCCSSSSSATKSNNNVSQEKTTYNSDGGSCCRLPVTEEK